MEGREGMEDGVIKDVSDLTSFHSNEHWSSEQQVGSKIGAAGTHSALAQGI